MQFIIWTGIVVLGLITLSGAGMIFFHVIGDFRRVAGKSTEAQELPKRRSQLRKVDLDALRKDRPSVRRAA